MSANASTTADWDIQSLNDLAQRLAMWRLREGKSSYSIPAPLWDEALAAARKVGLNHAAQILGLDVADINCRLRLPRQAIASVSQDASLADQPGEEHAQFIELPGVGEVLEPPPHCAEAQPVVAADSTVPDHPVAMGDAVVEVTTADGTKLTMRVPVSHLNISSLVHQFRGLK